MSNNTNRGSISTQSIAAKLKKVEHELGAPEKVNIDLLDINSAPLLFISGKLNRKKHLYTAKNFALLGALENQIKSYCKGVDLTILNYLIYLGLESIKENNVFKAIEWSEIERKIDR